MKSLVTIITPTYNRAENLQVLYESLLIQTNKSFVWLIVDDGSKDDTQTVVDSYIKEEKLKISYFRKENGGKHTALNLGIKNTETPLVIIVDSDDTLTEDAVEIINTYYRKYKNTSNLCGFSFLKRFADGRINGKLFVPDEKIGSYIECRVNGNDMNADKAEVFFTDRLKEFPFPEFKGEKFLGEDIIWARISGKYKMVHINKAIYIAEYLENGLTRNRRANNIKSPNGCVLRANEYLNSEVNFIFREKCALQYLIYGWFAGRPTKELIQHANQKLLVMVNVLPAAMIFKKWKKEFEDDDSKNG